jgi:hypothetical protein
MGSRSGTVSVLPILADPDTKEPAGTAAQYLCSVVMRDPRYIPALIAVAFIAALIAIVIFVPGGPNDQEANNQPVDPNLTTGATAP